MTIIPSSILNTSKLFGHLHILEAVLGSVFYIRADEIVLFYFSLDLHPDTATGVFEMQRNLGV